MINDPKFYYRFDGGTRYPYNYFNNRDYELGFDARSLGEPLDKAQSEAWQMGWHGWADIMDKSESAQPYF